MEGLYYSCSENKGADQLRGYREADLRLCFRICKKPVFLRRGSYSISSFIFQSLFVILVNMSWSTLLLIFFCCNSSCLVAFVSLLCCLVFCGAFTFIPCVIFSVSIAHTYLSPIYWYINMISTSRNRKAISIRSKKSITKVITSVCKCDHYNGDNCLMSYMYDIKCVKGTFRT